MGAKKMEDEEKELVETVSKLKVLLVEYRSIRAAVSGLCNVNESFIEKDGVQNSISKMILQSLMLLLVSHSNKELHHHTSKDIFISLMEKAWDFYEEQKSFDKNE